MDAQPKTHANADPRQAGTPFRSIERAPGAGKKPFVAKGHDAQLQEAQQNNIPVSIVCMDDDKSLDGIVVRRDKFTITIRLDAAQPFGGEDAMIYKHAIKMVVLRRRS